MTDPVLLKDQYGEDILMYWRLPDHLRGDDTIKAVLFIAQHCLDNFRDEDFTIRKGSVKPWLETIVELGRRARK